MGSRQNKIVAAAFAVIVLVYAVWVGSVLYKLFEFERYRRDMNPKTQSLIDNGQVERRESSGFGVF